MAEEDARRKAEEDARRKAEEDARRKAEPPQPEASQERTWWRWTLETASSWWDWAKSWWKG